MASWFQEILVLAILGATIYFAIRNNNSTIIESLVTLCFGYYFGQRGNNPPPPKT